MGMIKRRGNLEQHWVVIYAFLDLSFADRLKMKTYCHLFHKVEKLSQTDSSILLSLNNNYRYQSLCTKTIVARTGISRKHLEYNNKSPQQNAHQVIHKHCHATIISNVNERKMVEIRYNNNLAEPAQTITKHVNLDDISLVLGIHFSLDVSFFYPQHSISFSCIPIVSFKKPSTFWPALLSPPAFIFPLPTYLKELLLSHLYLS